MKITIIVLTLFVFYSKQVLSQTNYHNRRSGVSNNRPTNQPGVEKGQTTGFRTGTLKRPTNNFQNSYNYIQEANMNGETFGPDQLANYEEANLIADPNINSAISALQEWSKSLKTPDFQTGKGKKGWGNIWKPQDIHHTYKNKKGNSRAATKHG